MMNALTETDVLDISIAGQDIAALTENRVLKDHGLLDFIMSCTIEGEAVGDEISTSGKIG